MTLADKIVDARKRQALTQEDLAERSGITLRTIQRIENAQTLPRSYTIKAIAEALNVPLADLLSQQELSVAPQQVDPPLTDHNERTFSLQLLNLSAFAYLVLPFANIFVPLLIWNRNKSDKEIYAIGKKIIAYHILWTAATSLLLLLITLSQILAWQYFKIVPGPWILAAVIIMYFLNAWLIIRATIRLRQGKNNPYPLNTLIIP